MNSSAVEKHIVAWLKDYADRARVKGFVFVICTHAVRIIFNEND